jgi:hypothetical protein
MLGADLHAQTASVALVGVHRECLPIAVNPRLDASHQRQRALVIVAEFAHLENVVGTRLDTIFPGLASRAVDYRREHARILLAFGFR